MGDVVPVPDHVWLRSLAHALDPDAAETDGDGLVELLPDGAVSEDSAGPVGVDDMAEDIDESDGVGGFASLDDPVALPGDGEGFTAGGDASGEAAGTGGQDHDSDSTGSDSAW